MSNKKKNDTLGMPHGTACGRLRKMLLFQAVQKLSEDVCFKCNLIIEKIEDLSIEHKQPWEGISAKLFWDLDNIAYSHIRCNKSDRPTGGGAQGRIKSPEGMAWCYRCQKHKVSELFYNNVSNWNGKAQTCKECHHYYRNRPLVEQADTPDLNSGV